MQILDIVKFHYNQCLKDYLYMGISLIFLAIFLRIGFWGLYTTETADIEYNEELFRYPEYDHGDDVRIHGDVSEIEYYGDVDPEILKESKLGIGKLDATSGIYLHGLQVLDNLTMKKKLVMDSTLSNLLIYDGKFTDVAFRNVSFQNVSFMKTSFSNTRFQNVQFRNISYIDCTLDECELVDTSFQKGYSRELEISDSTMNSTDFADLRFSRTEFRRVELKDCEWKDISIMDTEFLGVRFDSCDWLDSTFYNATFDVIIFNLVDFQGSEITKSFFSNIFFDQDDPLDCTIIRSEDVYIRVDGDIRESYTEDTSIYGKFKLVRENGTIENGNGGNISYSYEIFVGNDIHHSIRIDGIFYVFILGGFTVITYAYGGKAVIMALVKFFLPFVFSGIGILVLYLSLPWDTFEKLGTWMILYFFPPLGKESVIPAAIAQGIHPLLIASAVAFIDIMVGLFLVWNFDLARKIPLIGSFIRRIEAKGNDVLSKKPWVEKLAFTGIVLFVMFPFQGSGAVGATIVGRMLGMDPKKVWYAVIIGAIVGCLIIAYTSAFAITFLLGISLAWALLTIALVVIFILLIYYYDKWGDWVRERW